MSTISRSRSTTRLLVTLLVIPFIALSLHPSPPLRETDVVVIGTVHSQTANFTVETLIQVLDRVKPYLILFEADSSFVDESLRLKEHYRKMTLEASAVTAFQAKTKVPLRPYDIEGRNKFYQETNYFQLQRDLSQMLGRLNQSGQLTDEARCLLEVLIAFDSIRDALQQDKAEVINSPACDAVIEKKQQYAGIRLREFWNY